VDAAGQPFLIAFAEEVDIRDDAARELGVLFLCPHAGEQPSVADADLDRRTDLSRQRHRWVGVGRAFGQSRKIERNAAARSGNFEHDADGFARVFHVRDTKLRIDLVNLCQSRILEIIHAQIGHVTPANLFWFAVNSRRTVNFGLKRCCG